MCRYVPPVLGQSSRVRRGPGLRAEKKVFLSDAFQFNNRSRAIDFYRIISRPRLYYELYLLQYVRDSRPAEFKLFILLLGRFSTRLPRRSPVKTARVHITFEIRFIPTMALDKRTRRTRPTVIITSIRLSAKRKSARTVPPRRFDGKTTGTLQVFLAGVSTAPNPWHKRKLLGIRNAYGAGG